MEHRGKGGSYVIRNGERVLVERTNWTPDAAQEVLADEEILNTDGKDAAHVFQEEIPTRED